MKARSPKILIFLVVFIDLLGFGIIVPILSYVAETYTKQYGGATHWLLIGVFSSAYSLFQMLFAPMWGRLSDVFGRRPIILISLLGSVLSYVIFALGGNIWVLLIGRSLGGIMAANISVAQAYIADITPEEERTGGMGMIGMAFGLGFTLGPAIGGIAAMLAKKAHLTEQTVPGMVAASICLVNLIWAAKSLPESLPAADRAKGAEDETHRAKWRRYASPGEVFKSLGHPLIGPLALVFFLAILGFSNFEVTLGLYVKKFPELGYTTTQIYGLFIYIGFALAFVSGYLARKLSKVVPDTALVVFGIACQVFALAAFPLMPQFAWMVFAGTFIALGQGLGNPAMLSLVSKTADPGKHGQVMGVTQSASSFGRIIGPLLATTLIWAGSGAPSALKWPFWAGALIMGGALVMAVAVRKRILARPINPEPAA